MANTTMETLTINIDAKVGNARKNLKNIATSLNELEEAGKNADWKVFKEIKRNLEGIAKIDFTNVASSLRDVVSAMRTMGISNKNLKNMPQVQMPQTIENTQIGSTQQEPSIPVFDLKSLKGTFQSVEQINSRMTELFSDAIRTNDVFESWRIALGECSLSARQVETIIKDFSKYQEPETDFVKLKDTLIQLGFTADQARDEMEKLGYTVEENGIKAFFSINHWKKLLKQMGRIAFYRLVRRAIQLITQAITTGIQNLAQYDEQFNESMSNITSSFTMVKNSIGTAVAPALESLEPIIVNISKAITDLNNSLGETFSALIGKKLFYKATLDVQNYAEALKKAKNASTGIDELNIVQKDTGNMFEEVDVDDSALGRVKALGAELAGILVTATAIAGLTAIVKGGGFLTALTNIGVVLGTIIGSITALMGLFDILFNGFNWGSVITFIGGVGVATVALTVKFGALGATIGAIILTVGGLAIAIRKLVDSWNDMGTWQKIIGVLGVVFGLIMAIGVAIALATGNYLKAGILTAFSVAGIATALAMGETAKNGISFATGGFPEDGFFFANHNELVGGFSNGKTAVANNEEITAGIYQAVLQAMQDSGSTGNRDIVVAIDGREVARAVNKQNATQGANVFKGGNFYVSR